jgi:hypothetical protein
LSGGTTGRGWLIYHPKRQVSRFGKLTVYHDSLSGNQDPYVWDRRFLHTACHITQMSPEVGDASVWVSGDTFPAFSHFWCDPVFAVQEKASWRDSNSIATDEPLIDLVPLLASAGLGLEELRIRLRAGWQSRPLRLPDGVAPVVYGRLRQIAPLRISGER